MGKVKVANRDLGNPTVRDEMGGLGKRILRVKCEPTSQIERAVVVTLLLREGAPQFYPDY